MLKIQTQQSTPPVITPTQDLRLRLSGIHHSLKQLDAAYCHHRDCLTQIQARVKELKKEEFELSVKLWESTETVKVIPPKGDTVKLFKKEKAQPTAEEIEAAAIKHINEMEEEDKLAFINKLIGIDQK